MKTGNKVTINECKSGKLCGSSTNLQIMAVHRTSSGGNGCFSCCGGR